jgi:hypothetical protein
MKTIIHYRRTRSCARECVTLAKDICEGRGTAIGPDDVEQYYNYYCDYVMIDSFFSERRFIFYAHNSFSYTLYML